MANVRFTEVAAHFRRKINDGELNPGDLMPSMKAVVEQFGCSINTANRAYAMLKAEGLTEVVDHRTRVAQPAEVTTSGAARLRRLARTGKPYAPGESSSNHWHGLRSVAEPAVADQLGVELYDEIVLRTRIFWRHGKPSVASLSCIHMRALNDVPELIEEERFERFWQEIYAERTGKTITRSPERMYARHASPDELEMLGLEVPEGTAVPVLVLTNAFHDEEGVIEVWEDVHYPKVWTVDND